MDEQGWDRLLFGERLFGKKLTIGKPGTSQGKNKNKQGNKKDLVDIWPNRKE